MSQLPVLKRRMTQSFVFIMDVAPELLGIRSDYRPYRVFLTCGRLMNQNISLAIRQDVHEIIRRKNKLIPFGLNQLQQRLVFPPSQSVLKLYLRI